MVGVVTRLDLTAGDVRARAAASRDARAARQMLAVALVLEGRPRTGAAETCGIDRQTLRDWGHRYNAEGLRELSDRRSQPGPKCRIRLRAG
jgi:transposase